MMLELLFLSNLRHFHSSADADPIVVVDGEGVCLVRCHTKSVTVPRSQRGQGACTATTAAAAVATATGTSPSAVREGRLLSSARAPGFGLVISWESIEIDD